MEITGLIVAIASFAVSALPGLAQTSGLLRARSRYESLRNSFDDASARLTRLLRDTLRGDVKGDARVLTLLEIGDVILPQVQARIWRRLGFLLAAALVSGSAAWLAAEELPLRAVTVIGAVLIGVNWVIAFVDRLTSRLMSAEERAFIRNLGRLQDRFYRDVVTESLEKFNSRCDALLARDEGVSQSEWSSLLGAFRRSLTPTIASGENPLPRPTAG